jgi:hypothetical protein
VTATLELNPYLSWLINNDFKLEGFHCDLIVAKVIAHAG